MSYQQINLYQPLFRKQQKIFSAKTMLQGLGIIVVGLLCFYGFTRWQSHSLAAQLEQLESRRTDAAKRLEQLRTQLPQQGKDLALEAEVEALRKDLAGRQRIAARLAATDAGNTTGFANYLEGLARQTQGSVWLTEVDVRRGGQELVLRGSTEEEEWVPRFIDRLKQEQAFRGHKFGEWEISRYAREKERKRYDFVMSTRALDSKEEKTRDSAP